MICRQRKHMKCLPESKIDNENQSGYGTCYLGAYPKDTSEVLDRFWVIDST